MGHSVMGLDTSPSTSRTKPVNIRSPEKFCLGSPAPSDAIACNKSMASDTPSPTVDVDSQSSADFDKEAMQRIWNDLESTRNCIPVESEDQKYDSDSDDSIDYSSQTMPG